MCGGCRLILVTVGTHTAPFDRLLAHMDSIAAHSDEPVFMQTGSSRFVPRFTKFERFLPENDYDRLFKEARVIVSHAGIGTILRAAAQRKPLICVPRLREFREHWDNHQLEICQEMSTTGSLSFVIDIRTLDICKITAAVAPSFSSMPSHLAERVMFFLRNPISEAPNRQA